jgi:hypothetical protein
LKKLGEITIERIDFAGNISESTTFSCAHDDSSMQATLSKAHRKGFENPQPSLKHYHITRRLLKNLSLDEHRDSDTAEVVLAFPLDVKSEPTPIIGPQEVYAYLPIGDFGFSVSESELHIYTRLTTYSFLFSPTSLPRPAGKM